MTNSRKTWANSKTWRPAGARARDLEHEARHAAERDVRGELMKQLAARLPFDVPPSLFDREVDCRLRSSRIG